jgi:hypothetical protein
VSTITIPLCLFLRLEGDVEGSHQLTKLANYGALESLGRLHLAAFYDGDVSPSDFGVKDTETATLQLIRAGPCFGCDPSNTDACYEIRRLMKALFDEREE